MEQEDIQKIFNELKIIEKSIESINTVNTIQSKELKRLKIKQCKTSAMLHQVMAALCIAVLFFYFENSAEISEDKKKVIESIILSTAGLAGLNSGLRLTHEEKQFKEEEEEFF